MPSISSARDREWLHWSFARIPVAHLPRIVPPANNHDIDCLKPAKKTVEQPPTAGMRLLVALVDRL
jgi:hypothetical protein